MDNPIELVTNALEGDIEIAGKRIPKVALVAGGGVLIVILILLSRRGSGSAAKSNGVFSGDSTGLGSSTPVSSDSAAQETGDLLSGSIADVQAQLETALADQSTSLTDLISQNANTQANDLNSQLGAVYDQLASMGAVTAPSYSEQYAPTPFDTGYSGYSMPLDSGYASYAPNQSVSIPVVSGSSGKNSIPDIKPSNVKPSGGTKTKGATLGTALSRPSLDKISQLSAAPKPGSFIPSSVTAFNKQNSALQKLTALGKQGKVTTKPSSITGLPVNQKVPYNASNTANAKKPNAVGSTNKIGVSNKPSSIQKAAAKPAQVAQPKQNPFKAIVNRITPKPTYTAPKPVYTAPKPVYRPPTPAYRPSVYGFSNQANVPNYSNLFRSMNTSGKVGAKSSKKGR